MCIYYKYFYFPKSLNTPVVLSLQFAQSEVEEREGEGRDICLMAINLVRVVGREEREVAPL